MLARLCSYPPAETRLVAEVIVRGYSASVVDVAIPIRRRIVYIVTLNIARIMLSSRRYVSAVGGALAATLRERLRDLLPIRYRP